MERGKIMEEADAANEQRLECRFEIGTLNFIIISILIMKSCEVIYLTILLNNLSFHT